MSASATRHRRVLRLIRQEQRKEILKALPEAYKKNLTMGKIKGFVFHGMKPSKYKTKEDVLASLASLATFAQ